MTTVLTAAEWVSRMRDTPVREVAAALGHTAKEARGANGGAVYGCPACASLKRHTKRGDKRGAVGIERTGRGWRCFQCDASGDALDFVAFELGGARLSELAQHRKADVRRWCMGWLGLDGSRPARPAPPPRAPEPERQPEYLPPDELAAFWARCGRVDVDGRVSTWLRDARRIDPGLVADLDLARVAPATQLPRWTGYTPQHGGAWRSWPAAGLRLVVPVFDGRGGMRSVLFRRALETGESWPPKSVGAAASRTGLGMACPLARQVLAQRIEGQRIVVAEGETDFLTFATVGGESNETPPVVLGGFSGSWSLLEHVPRGSVLVVQTHADNDGVKYAREILRAVRPRWCSGEVKVRLPEYFRLVGERVELA